MRIKPGSLRLAFFLIAILLFLIILSAIIPQAEIASGQIIDLRQKLGEYYTIIDSLYLDRIYYSPYFFMILALLGINLLWANIERIRKLFSKISRATRLRYLGSMVFHFSIIIIISGIILNYLYKYEGVFAVTEGQRVLDNPTDYFREFKGPLLRPDYGRFELRLIKIDSIIPEISRSDRLITFDFQRDNAMSSDTLEITTGHPLKISDLEFHYGTTYGYTPEIVLTDTADKTIFSSFVRLATQKTEQGLRFFDYVYIENPNYKISIELLPSSGTGQAKYDVAVEKEEKTVFRNQLTPIDTARFNGYRLTVPGLRSWCYINVVKSPFLNVIFGGFWIGLSGIFLSLVVRITGRGRISHEQY